LKLLEENLIILYPNEGTSVEETRGRRGKRPERLKIDRGDFDISCSKCCYCNNEPKYVLKKAFSTTLELNASSNE